MKSGLQGKRRKSDTKDSTWYDPIEMKYDSRSVAARRRRYGRTLKGHRRIEKVLLITVKMFSWLNIFVGLI